jgi:hypothetical protein
MNECLHCGYEGKDGYWVGTYTDSNGNTGKLEGTVYECEDSITFDLMPIIKSSGLDNDNIEEITGEANCPNCKNNLYFSK